MRKPNANCHRCKQPIYRRPKQIEQCKHLYCSKACKSLAENKILICAHCHKEFSTYKNRQRKYCSRQCNGKAQRHSTKRKKTERNQSLQHLRVLQDTFTFDSCMVDGCTYNKIYDIHRLIHGKDGGTYEIGNMFAVCPNHHAEVHRHICTLGKINDHTLKATYRG